MGKYLLTSLWDVRYNSLLAYEMKTEVVLVLLTAIIILIHLPLSLFMLTRTSWDSDSISFLWTLHWGQINEQLHYLAQADIVTWVETKSHDIAFVHRDWRSCVSPGLWMKVLPLYPCSSQPLILLQPSWTSRSTTVSWLRASRWITHQYILQWSVQAKLTALVAFTLLFKNLGSVRFFF